MMTTDLIDEPKSPRPSSRHQRLWRAVLRNHLAVTDNADGKKIADGTVKIDASRAGYVEGALSIVINTALFALKLYAGIAANSLALIADAWHTLSDSLSSLVVIIAAKLSKRAPDREHPFGHGRWEQIASLFIGFLLATVAFDFLYESILKLSKHGEAKFGWFAIAAMIISVVVKEVLASYAFYLASETGNSTLKADGWHHRTDALSSLAVLLGILIAGTSWWIDSALGICVAAMIFYAAYQVLKETISQILGETPNAALVARITETVREIYPFVFRVHHFHLHNYGRQKEVTFHLKIDEHISVEESHEIVSEIERTLNERFQIVATVHVEPLSHHDESIDV